MEDNMSNIINNFKNIINNNSISNNDSGKSTKAVNSSDFNITPEMLSNLSNIFQNLNHNESLRRFSKL